MYGRCLHRVAKTVNPSAIAVRSAASSAASPAALIAPHRLQQQRPPAPAAASSVPPQPVCAAPRTADASRRCSAPGSSARTARTAPASLRIPAYPNHRGRRLVCANEIGLIVQEILAVMTRTEHGAPLRHCGTARRWLTPHTGAHGGLPTPFFAAPTHTHSLEYL